MKLLITIGLCKFSTEVQACKKAKDCNQIGKPQCCGKKMKFDNTDEVDCFEVTKNGY